MKFDNTTNNISFVKKPAKGGTPPIDSKINVINNTEKASNFNVLKECSVFMSLVVRAISNQIKNTMDML